MFHYIQKDIQIDDMIINSAKQEQGDALCLIGNQYYLKHTPFGYVKSMEWYFRSAATGYTDAMYNIGHLYLEGKGTAQNYQKALEWFKRAADLGHSTSKQELEMLKNVIASANENNVKEFTVFKSTVHEIQDEYEERHIEALRIEKMYQDQMIGDMETRIQQLGLNHSEQQQQQQQQDEDVDMIE